MDRLFLILIFFLVAISAQAGEFEKSLYHVTVVVSDFEASKEFYLDTLELELIEAPWLPEKQMFLAAGDGLEIHVGEVAGVTIAPNNFNHFALAVKEFDAYLEHLQSKGVIYTRLGGGEDFFISTRPDNIRQTWVTDPDGYWIEINDVR